MLYLHDGVGELHDPADQQASEAQIGDHQPGDHAVARCQVCQPAAAGERTRHCGSHADDVSRGYMLMWANSRIMPACASMLLCVINVGTSALTACTCQPKAVEDDPKAIQLNILHSHQPQCMAKEALHAAAQACKLPCETRKCVLRVKVTCQYSESLFRFMTHSV